MPAFEGEAMSASARWTVDAVTYLLRETHCPRCLVGVLVDGHCSACGAVLDTMSVSHLRAQTAAAVTALGARQRVVDALDVSGRNPARAGVMAARAEAGTGAVPPQFVPRKVASPPVAPPQFPRGPVAAAPSTGSQITLQSVLAVAGAALVGIASLVFAFLNPDLTDVVARSSIVAGAGALFLAGAWYLQRRSLRFSAETIGTLGLVFAAVAGYSFLSLLPSEPLSALLRGVAMLIGSAAMFAAGRRFGMRTWLWGGAVGGMLSPAIAAGALSHLDYGVLAWEVGGLAVAAAGLGVHPLLHRASAALGSPLGADRAAVTVLQIAGAAFAALATVNGGGVPDGGGITVAVLAAIAAVGVFSARHQIPRVWSGMAGVALGSAAIAVPLSFADARDAWLPVFTLPLATHAALLVAAALPRVRAVHRSTLVWSAWAVARASVLPAVFIGMVQLFFTGTSTREAVSDRPFDPSIAAIGGLVVVAAGSFALLRLGAPSRKTERAVAAAALTAAVVVAATTFGLPLAVCSVLAVLAAVALALAVTRLPVLRDAERGVRLSPILGAHLLVLVAGIAAWAEDWSMLTVGFAAVAALAIVSTSVTARFRPAYIAVGFLDGLGVLVAALGLTGLDPTAALCIATTVGVLVALACTLARRVGTADWIAVLGSAAVPFLIAIGLVLFARTAWTALPTAASFALSAVVVFEQRRRVEPWLRCLAATVLIPALAVITVTIGAQMLTDSGSPITLPIIAVLVAAGLTGATLVTELLGTRGLNDATQRLVRLAIEASSLITGTLAVLLAILRPAAGAGTAFIVLLIFGAGGAIMARSAKRRYGWWVAAAAWTGALWSAWALFGVSALEPYLFPPSLAAIATGFIATARGRSGTALYTAGLACAVLPTLGLLAVLGSAVESGTDGPGLPWRALALLGASTFFCVLPVLAARSRWAGRLRPLDAPTGAAAIVAAAAGVIQALRCGLDPALADQQLVILPVFAFSLAAAALAALAGARLARTRPNRFVLAPAIVYLTLAPLTANRLDPVPIALLSLLAVALLVGMLLTAVRGLRGPTVLPPVWLWFLAGWCAAVAAWSVRALRVEAFSLPLGLALLVVGVLALRATTLPDGEPTPRTATPSLTAWPTAFRGSWALLSPGIVVMVLPSIVATGTDPQTWRAVLVMALALACILVGALRRLAAPFIVGLVVLPVENIVVFAVQVGRSIGAMPWWITLAAAGAVLLVLAVTSERKSAGPRSPLARMRDLR